MIKTAPRKITLDEDILLIQDKPTAQQALQTISLLKKNRSRLEPFFSGIYANGLEYAAIMKELYQQEQKFKKNEGVLYHIYYQNNTCFIGEISVLNYSHSVEISYWIDADLEGKGIISRAFDSVRKTLFNQEISCISAYCDSNNLRSKNFLKHKGLDEIGTIHLTGQPLITTFIQNRFDFFKTR